MGGIAESISGLFGVSKSSPTVDTSAAMREIASAETDTDERKKTLAAARAKIFGTSGGVLGEELQSGSVSKRSTLFGN